MRHHHVRTGVWAITSSQAVGGRELCVLGMMHRSPGIRRMSANECPGAAAINQYVALRSFGHKLIQPARRKRGLAGINQRDPYRRYNDGNK